MYSGPKTNMMNFGNFLKNIIEKYTLRKLSDSNIYNELSFINVYIYKLILMVFQMIKILIKSKYIQL